MVNCHLEKNETTSTSLRMDKTDIKVKGKQHYLYRVTDHHGNTLDIYMIKHRNASLAYVFTKRLIQRYGEPRALITDKYATAIVSVNKIKTEGFLKSVDYRLSKYLNNRIKQDYRQIKNAF